MKKRIISSLFLLMALCAASAFAQQEVKPQNKQVSEEQYKAVCRQGFVGASLNLNVVNADISDILNYITKEYGYDFVLDASVGRKVTTVNFDGIPWNVALNNILEPEDLMLECGEKSLLIKPQIKKEVAASEEDADASPLYTIFIKLEKLPKCPRKGKCVKKSQALNRLKSSVAERLSKKGQVEVDEKSQTLIVTDARGNLNALVKLVETLDNEAFYNQAK